MKIEDVELDQQVLVHTPAKLDRMGTVAEVYPERHVVGVLVDDFDNGWGLVYFEAATLSAAPVFDWSRV